MNEVWKTDDANLVKLCGGRAKSLKSWSERRDLNSRPLVPQTSALTGLRHAPPSA